MGYRFVQLKWRLLIPFLDGLLALFFFWKKGIGPPENVTKILLIKLNNLGDTLPLFLLARECHRRYPGVKIDILIRPSLKELFEDYDGVRHVMTMNPFEEPRYTETKVGLLACMKTVRRLRKEKYDVILDVRGDIRCSVIASLMGAKFVGGFNDGGGHWLQNRSITPSKSWDFITRDMNILRALDPDWDISDPMSHLFFPVSISRKEIIRERLDRLNMESLSFAVIHTGSGRAEKEVDSDSVKNALTDISWPQQKPLLLIGLEHEREGLEVLASSLHPWVAKVIVFSNIPELAAIISESKMMVCSDSGPMHIAGFLKKPIKPIINELEHQTKQHKSIWCPYPLES
ncbi:MAG: glycosyltransferase family 9 protein [Candidatus Margulisbacteria bacterium]|nr:glycosyltransferase family 9 protein [Candidatus Margulisiibacteriota bacterium]